MEAKLNEVYDAFQSGRINEQKAIAEMRQIWSVHEQTRLSQSALFEKQWEPLKKTTWDDKNQSVVKIDDNAERNIFVFGQHRTEDLKGFDLFCESNYSQAVECFFLNSEANEIARRYIEHTVELLSLLKRWFEQTNKQRTVIHLCLFNQQTDDSAVVDVNGSQSELLSGLFSVLLSAAQESPLLDVRLVEFETSASADPLIEGIKAINSLTKPSNTWVRYTDGMPYVASWKAVTSHSIANDKATTDLPWKESGVYLITGGLGGLGVIFAREIAKKTRDVTLVLIGRRELALDKTSKADAHLQALEELGARCVYQAIDVTDQDAVNELVSGIVEEYGKLNGILHSAGLIRDGLIINKDVGQIAEVLAPKVSGLVQLDNASRDISIDMFILFSSISGVFGNAGQADYSAANAFMDSYAYYRNRLVVEGKRYGLTMSINWPFWQDGTMQLSDIAQKILHQKTGLIPMQTQTGLDAFYQAYNGKKEHVVVVEGDLKKVSDELFQRDITPVKSDFSVLDAPELNLNKTHTSESLFLLTCLAELLQVERDILDENTQLKEFGCDAVLLSLLGTRLEAEYAIEQGQLDLSLNQTVKQIENRVLALIGMSPTPRHSDAEDVVVATAVKPVIKSADDAVFSRELQEKSTEYFVQMFSSSLKLPVDRIDAKEPLETYGVDSLMVLEMTNSLEKVFGSLSKTLFFEYQTLDELSLYFVKNYREKMIDLVGLSSLQTNHSSSKINTENALAKEPMSPPTRVESIQSIKARAKRGSHPRDSNNNEHTEDQYQSNVLDKQTDSVVDDIAIIGLSGRYPMARSLDQFWQNLSLGKDCITELPTDRWDHDLYFNSNKNELGKSYSKWGGFIDGVDEFDPLFFNISPNDAKLMDPQERLFLQCVYETIEDAGYTRGDLSGSDIEGKVGVYVGAMYQQYQLYGSQQIGNTVSAAVSCNIANIANRISYFCNFSGPSMALDTMCSSSLTTLHLACQSLQTGESKLAIAGGVNISIHPNKYVMLSQGHFVSSKGRCESFGEGGEGYVPGEGVGAILLKPLKKAIADGDHIYGLVKGTSVNHGGRANGYTVPNPNSQANVIRDAFKRAQIDPRTVSYMEAHGTGTSLGDPIEIAGLNKVFRENTDEVRYCAIGSVKSNIGHCESAAGIAGLTKVLLQMKYKKIAPSLHSSTLNPNIDFENNAFVVQQSLTNWERPKVDIDGVMKEYPRTAGISSFGAGGSNAHVILQEYIPQTVIADQQTLPQDTQFIIVLSAKTEDGLKRKVVSLINTLKQEKEQKRLIDIAYTLQVGREAMNNRLAMVVNSKEELLQNLEGYLKESKPRNGVLIGNIREHKETVSALSDVDTELVIKAWIEKKKYSRLLTLWVKGLKVDWSELYQGTQPKRVSLPSYPFERNHYWVDGANMQALQPFVNASTQVELSRIEPLKTRVINHQNPVPGIFYQTDWRRSEANHQLVKSQLSDHGVLIVYEPDSRALVDAISHYYDDINIAFIELTDVTQQFDDRSWQVSWSEVGQHLVSHLSDFKIDELYFVSVQCQYADLPPLMDVEQSRADAFLQIINALNSLNLMNNALSLKLITQDVFRLAKYDSAFAPRAASLSGLSQTLCNEYAKVSSCCIDLSAADYQYQKSPESEPEKYWSTMATRLVSQQTDLEGSVIALRNMQSFERFFKPLDLPNVSDAQSSIDIYKHQGVYAIMGGATGIGLQLAKYLAQNYQAKISIIGRSPESDDKKALLSELEDLGGKAIYISANITEEASLKHAIDSTKAQFGGINGVVHSAAVLKDVMLSKMDTSTLNLVMAPKVQGSLNLARVTKDENLDFMVFFSSVAGFAGMPGQANYAAAATFQDSFVSFLDSQRDYPVRVIDWGFWGEVGMAANDFQTRKFAAQGILPIQTKEGIDGIKRVLMHSEPQVIAFKANEAVLKQLGISSYTTLPNQNNVDQTVQTHTAELVPIRNAPALEATKSEDVLTSLLNGFSDLSGIPVDAIDLDADWDELGIDSIKIMSMLSNIEARWNIKIYPNELQEYSNLNSFSEYLVGEINTNMVNLDSPSLLVSEVNQTAKDLDDQQNSDINSILMADFCELSGISSDQLDIQAPWEEMGIDSINMMSMLERIQSRWGIRIYPNELQEYSTFETFSAYLIEEISQLENQTIEPKVDTSLVENNHDSGDNPKTIDAHNLQQVDVTPSKKPILYVLSTPRAGSTLLRVMLMGNEHIFSPPELHLLPFDSCKQRNEYLTENNRQFLGEGFIETVAQLENLSAEDARARVSQLEEQDMSIGDVYGMLQELAQGRFVVDKSPSYASELDILHRAEEISQDSLYIFLIRHPLSVMESFVRNRFDKLLGIDVDPWEYAETLWQTYNRNLLCFLKSVPKERQFLIRYEDLVTNPEVILMQLCQQMKIPFDSNMMTPYDGERMTKGLHEHSMTVGDPNFAQHTKIDPSLANAWQKQKEKLNTLQPATLLVAQELGYDVGQQNTYPLLPAQQNFMHQFGDSPAWHLVQKTTYRGNFDSDGYHQALQVVVDKNASLRLSFEKNHKSGQWCQRINQGVQVAVEREDISHLNANERESRLTEIEMQLNQTLSIDTAPLLRSTVVKLEADIYRIILVVHHLVADGITLGLINRGCMSFFDVEQSNQALNLMKAVKNDDSYVTYIKESQTFLNHSQYLRFWQKQVAMKTKERCDYFLDSTDLLDDITSERAYTIDVELADFGITDFKSKSKLFDYVSVALYSCIGKRTDNEQSVITHRLHRRDLASPNHYFSTMGWFAGDVVLGLDLRQSNKERLDTFRSLFKSIPLGGTGYEVLSNNKKIPAAHEVAPFRLNYQPEMPMGKLSNSEVHLFESSEHERQYLMDLIVRVGSEKITIIVRYSENRHEFNTVEAFVMEWLAELTETINEDRVSRKNSKQIPLNKHIEIDVNQYLKKQEAIELNADEIEKHAKKGVSRLGKLINPIYNFRAAYERRRAGK